MTTMLQPRPHLSPAARVMGRTPVAPLRFGLVVRPVLQQVSYTAACPSCGLDATWLATQTPPDVQGPSAGTPVVLAVTCPTVRCTRTPAA